MTAGATTQAEKEDFSTAESGRKTAEGATSVLPKLNEEVPKFCNRIDGIKGTRAEVLPKRRPIAAPKVDKPKTSTVKTTTTSVSTQAGPSTEASSNLLLLLRVSTGRNFVNWHRHVRGLCRNCPAPDSSYHVSCRLFSPRNLVVSDHVVPSDDASAGGCDLIFALQHCFPFPAKREFLEKHCQDNHLVLEVWQSTVSSGEETLVGLATLPLNSIWDAFQVTLNKYSLRVAHVILNDAKCTYGIVCRLLCYILKLLVHCSYSKMIPVIFFSF